MQWNIKLSHHNTNVNENVILTFLFSRFRTFFSTTWRPCPRGPSGTSLTPEGAREPSLLGAGPGAAFLAADSLLGAAAAAVASLAISWVGVPFKDEVSEGMIQTRGEFFSALVSLLRTQQQTASNGVGFFFLLSRLLLRLYPLKPSCF